MGSDLHFRGIEQLLLRHGAVAACTVTEQTTIITAAVELHVGMNVSAEELARFVRERSVDDLIPQRFLFVKKNLSDSINK